MTEQFSGWQVVVQKLHTIAKRLCKEDKLDEGQMVSLGELAMRLPNNGVIIADEVGMGKTRIAATVARAVIEAGGRVAILVPPGLGDQWRDELRQIGVDAPPLLRSLNAYLNAWDINSLQYDTTKVWGDHSVLLLSHSFCNWSLKGNIKENWRWALLPAVLTRLMQQARESGRVRIGANREKFDDKRIEVAADWIVSNGDPQKLASLLKQDFGAWGKNSLLFDPSNYTKETEYRKGLEWVVGLGLGIFDLVIIDEAHKSRGADSVLTHLISGVVQTSSVMRHLALTATPVELDASQWTQMLQRIWVDPTQEHVKQAIKSYISAITEVRQAPYDEAIRKQYQHTARVFQQALTPYLLRRDKRMCKTVQQFEVLSNQKYYHYRHEREISVETATLAPEWKQAVCAAEALSFVTRLSDHAISKQMRLTLGNGHGIASMLDQLLQDDKEDAKQMVQDEQNTTEPILNQQPDTNTKRQQRVQWWQNVMLSQSFARNKNTVLFEHPAILTAVEYIESICAQGEKVLVFGRFTRPLRALVQLLNAREMLRCLDNQQPWPQAEVHENEWHAVVAAWYQLNKPGEPDLDVLNKRLSQQYKKLQEERRRFRRTLLDQIKEGLRYHPTDVRAGELFAVFNDNVAHVTEQVQDNDEHELAVVARVMQGLVSPNPIAKEIAAVFIDIAKSAYTDMGDADDNKDTKETSATKIWNNIVAMLAEEYRGQEGGFARLMYGKTKPQTRRLLQLAFNRKDRHPKVLVAQSMVGREGLNLHKACCRVVLLHPEWNPGVVEQQIGRVDRIGSLWEEKLEHAIEAGQTSDLPKIEFCPVVFQGTYDEHNWQVLRNRWEDLRSQLHGLVISTATAEKFKISDELVQEINEAAPRFFPGLS